MRRQLLFIVLTTLVLALFGGCGGDPADPFIGKWQSVDGSSTTGTIEFFEDGTVILDGSTVGDYTVLDETRIRLDGNTGSLVFGYEVSDERLVLTDDGERETFRRVEAGEEVAAEPTVEGEPAGEAQPEATPLPAPTATAEPGPRLVPFESEGGGVTFRYPETWELLQGSSLGETLIRVGTDENVVAQMRPYTLSPGQALMDLAVMPVADLAAQTQGDDLATMLRNEFEPSENLELVSEVRTEPAGIDGQEMARVTVKWMDPETGESQIWENALVRNERLQRAVWAVASMRSDDAERYTPLFEEILASIELVRPAGPPIEGELAPGEMVEGDAPASGYRGWTLEAEAGQLFYAVATPDDENVELEIELLDPALNPLGTHRDGVNEVGATKLHWLFLPERGTYTIAVGSAEEAAGRYTLAVTGFGKMADLQTLEPGVEIQGNLGPGERDLYRYTGTSNREREVRLRPEGEGRMYLVHFCPEAGRGMQGRLVGPNSAYNNNVESREGVTCIVQVSGVDGAGGGYALTLDPGPE